MLEVTGHPNPKWRLGNWNVAGHTEHIISPGLIRPKKVSDQGQRQDTGQGIRKQKQRKDALKIQGSRRQPVSLEELAETKLMDHLSLPGGQWLSAFSWDQHPQGSLSTPPLLASSRVSLTALGWSGKFAFLRGSRGWQCCWFRIHILRTTDLRILEPIFSSLWNFKGLFSLTRSSYKLTYFI